MRASLLAAVFVLGGAACLKRPPEVTPEPVTTALPDAPPPPIEVPAREGPKVVVLPAVPVRAPLFAPELARLERWVARHLALQGEVVLDPVQPDELETFRRRLEAGGRSEAGPRCLAAMPVRASMERAWPEAHRAHVRADCAAAACFLRVDVDAPGGAPVAGWSAKVEDGATLEGWEAAARALKPVGVPAPRAAQPRPSADTFTEGKVEIGHLGAFGGWTWKPTVKELAQELPIVRQCHERGHAPTGPTQVVLGLGADGRVTACGAHGWRDPPLAEQLDCYCAAVSSATFGEGAPGRRLALELLEVPDLDHLLPSGDRITARIEGFKSSDPAIREHWVVSALPWVAMCYGITRLSDEVVFPARFTLDARGQVTQATIGGLEKSSVLGACVTGYLQNVVLPCPFSGSAELEFTVKVRRVQAPVERDAGVSSRRRPSGPRASPAANPG